MDINALKAKREEQDRLIAHVERFGEDLWPDGTALLVISRVTDDDGERYRRTCWMKDKGQWWNTNSGKPSTWDEIAASTAKWDIADMQIADNWVSFDSLVKSNGTRPVRDNPQA